MYFKVGDANMPTAFGESLHAQLAKECQQGEVSHAEVIVLDLPEKLKPAHAGVHHTI